MAADLTPILGQENAVRQDFAAKSAANAFSRNLGQTRGSRNLSDFRMGFKRQLPSFTSSFGRRGLSGGGIRSGVMQGAMRNFVGDYTRELGRREEDNFNELQQYDFNQSRFQAERDRALADLAAHKAALIANTAAQISALKPYMGGG
jgi:hypothetical protein